MRRFSENATQIGKEYARAVAVSRRLADRQPRRLLFAICVLTSAEASATRQTTWTPFDQPLTETDPLDRTTTHDYNARAERTATTYPDGSKETFGFNAEGNTIASTGRAGRASQYVHDLLNRLTQTVYPDGATEQNEYDAAHAKGEKAPGSHCISQRPIPAQRSYRFSP